MKPIKQFEATLDSTLRELRRICDEMPWENADLYALWLAQTYYMVSHTSVFLAMMAVKYGVENKQGHAHTLKHLRQEMRHEELALNDIRALGRELRDLPEVLETSLLYQTQYYWIERFGPVPHLGYSLLLEGLSVYVAQPLAERVQKLHGKGCTSFLQVHSTADKHHLRDSVEHLKASDPTRIALVDQNLRMSTELYRRMVDEIRARAEAKPSLRKAA